MITAFTARAGRRPALQACFLAVIVWTTSMAAQQPPPRVSSPEVHADRRVTFRLLAPNVRDVTVSGEFMQGSRPLEKAENGVWTLTVGPLEPEIYHYTFTIDGVRTIDPANPEVKTGSTASTLQSVLEVRGDTPAFYDGRPVPHGDVRTHWFESKSLDGLRRVTVYTPPGYDSDLKRRYPVLYLFHGANADETAWVRRGRMNLILDNLIADRKAAPFIVVMPFGYGVPPGAPAPAGQTNTSVFGKHLVDEVMPYIESRYRTLPTRDQRAIAGLSMGGGQALTIGLNKLNLFGYVAGFSSGFGAGADFSKTSAGAIASPDATNRKLRLLWVGCGKEDGAFAASKSFSEFLTKHGVQHTFRETPGAHTWIVWRRHLLEVAPLLFQ
jgi:enterochelin esterase-like enzyme